MAVLKKFLFSNEKNKKKRILKALLRLTIQNKSLIISYFLQKADISLTKNNTSQKQTAVNTVYIFAVFSQLKSTGKLVSSFFLGYPTT